MRKFLLCAGCVLSIVSCSEEQNAVSDLTNVAKRTSVVDSLAGDYKDFQLAGGPAKGWYSVERGNCSGEGSACADTTVIVSRPKLEELMEQLERFPKEVAALFLTYKEVALETFDSKLVEGTIDQFFAIRIDFNQNTNTKYVRFYRITDGIDVGVYPIQF